MTQKRVKHALRALNRRRGSEQPRAKPLTPVQASTIAAPAPVAAAPTVHEALRRRFDALEPLRTFPELRSGRRLSIVTDSVDKGLLYGGVGTAILFGTMLANRIGADLRLITRFHEADPGQLGALLTLFGVRPKGHVECIFSPPRDGADLSVFADDLFLTTSWWTTRATLGAVDPRQIIYLLQEDERMFYPVGDERRRCAEVLGSANVRFVVNSQILFTHLCQGAEPLPNIARNGCWFEPAFPIEHYYDDARERRHRKKKNFFFYARPNNLRNLYWRGLEAIAAAIEEGILLPNEWNILFVGRDLEPVALPRGTTPSLLQNLPWSEYASLIRKVDLGLSLMDTPHPSYPPLDLAASGAVVVTNRSGSKASLASYSKNIICADPTLDGLKDGLRRAMAIVDDDALRLANYERNGLMRDWPTALERALGISAELAR